MSKNTEINKILEERGNRYGDFETHASITQTYKTITRTFLDNIPKQLSDSQMESLDMIFHKIGRIVNGDPNYADSWIDIAGYAQLVVDQLNKKS